MRQIRHTLSSLDVIQFLTAKSFHFRNEKLPLHMIFKAPNKNCSRRQFYFLLLSFKENKAWFFHVNPLPSRGFTWNIKSYFLWKTIKKYLWMSSAAVVIGALRVNYQKADDRIFFCKFSTGGTMALNRSHELVCRPKSNIYFWNLSDLWPRSKDDVDLWYSLNFINSFSWMLQATLRPKAAKVSKKINDFHFFPYKILCDQIWPWCKIGQGQPSVIIWTILVVLA